MRNAYLALAAAIVGGYFLFRNTLNRIQYIERLRIYWITRDDGREVELYQPRFMRSFMRQTHEPYWRGEGIQIRLFRWTFQVGRLTSRADDLEFQIGDSGWLSTEPRDLERF